MDMWVDKQIAKEREENRFSDRPSLENLKS